jgi:hypothetical protein
VIRDWYRLGYTTWELGGSREDAVEHNVPAGAREEWLRGYDDAEAEGQVALRQRVKALKARFRALQRQNMLEPIL